MSVGGRTKDITGQRFSSLTVLAFSRRSPGKARIAIWQCRCDCGKLTEVYGTALRSGTTKSCGCEKAKNVSKALTRHGMTKTPTFFSWRSMLARCGNPNATDYRWYGGVGVTVCERWQSFENFLADMGKRPVGKTLDRINPYGNYEPGNCRWATSLEQAHNKRSSRVEGALVA